jgi:hypothetical protein
MGLFVATQALKGCSQNVTAGCHAFHAATSAGDRVIKHHKETEGREP